MGSDYDWELPSFDSGSSWTDTGNYDLSSPGDSSFGSGSSYMADSTGFNFNDDDWYVDSTGSSTDVDTSYMSDIWGWVKSDQGVGVLGGAANAAFKLWQMDQANKMKKELAAESAAAAGPSAAELYDARVKTHNRSINQPMNMGLVEYKKP